jgi:hypothetical protein
VQLFPSLNISDHKGSHRPSIHRSEFLQPSLCITTDLLLYPDPSSDHPENHQFVDRTIVTMAEPIKNKRPDATAPYVFSRK